MPGTTVSPSRTGRLVTTPSSGAITSYFARMSATRVSPACACATRRCAEVICASDLRALRLQLFQTQLGLPQTRLCDS